jgi:aminopeptidase N
MRLVPILAVWAVSCAVGSGQSKVFGDPNVAQYAPSRSYHVQNYKITARIDMVKGEIFGDEVVTLQPLQAGLKSFYLDSSQLQIDSVTLGKGTALSFKLEDPKLWITLDRGYSPAETVNVRIVYRFRMRA